MRVRSILIRIARYGIPGIFLVLLVLFGVGALVEANKEIIDANRFEPQGDLYDIGGRRLHLYCLGKAVQDQAPVILVAGSGDSIFSWWNLQQQLAPSGLVCSYDRSGYGWSEVGPRPRTTAALAEELQALLQAAGLHPPFLLVGHSLGGLVVRQFALDYPEEVQSLVLVESMNAEALARLPRLLIKPLLTYPAYKTGTAAVLETAGIIRLFYRWGILEVSPVLTSLPGEVLSAAEAVYLNPRAMATASREQAAIADSVLALIPRNLPDDLPIISLLAVPSSGDVLEPKVIRDFEGLSSKSQVWQVTVTGHYLHLITPGEVLDAVWKLQQR